MPHPAEKSDERCDILRLWSNIAKEWACRRLDWAHGLWGFDWIFMGYMMVTLW
jgi:hypothetical protein